MSEKEHLKHCIFFAFQLKRNAAQTVEMICSALDEDAVTHKTCKKWFQRFREDNFDLTDRERSRMRK